VVPPRVRRRPSSPPSGSTDTCTRPSAEGARGFLLKTVPPSQLVDGVRVVAGGDMLLAKTRVRDRVGRVMVRQESAP
jgi:DNA-binding NarL/FixJ family response regulator